MPKLLDALRGATELASESWIRERLVVALKIAMVTLYNPFESIRGGIESVVYNQSKVLARLKHEVWLLTMGNVQKETKLNVNGVNLWILPDRKLEGLFARNSLFIREGKPVLEKMEKEFGIDVFNGQAGHSGPLAFVNLRNAKKILTVHTVDGENFAKIKDCWRVRVWKDLAGEVLQYPILKAWRSFFLWRCDALIFVSSFALGEFRIHYPYLKSKPCYVIENGFPEVDGKRDSLPNKKDYDFDFIYAGRVDKRKGVDLLVKAANLLRKTSSLKIAVIGDGPWRKSVEDLAIRLNVTENFRFFGYTNDSPIEVCKAARCLVLPSLYESDPLIVKECMSIGMPMICSDIPPLRQRLSCYGKGLTFRCGDYQDLAKTMLRFLSSREYFHPNETSLKRLDTAHIRSWEGVVQDYIEVFESVAKRGY
jgi:glycosyltransferase involved in cell wall biosynthesis